MKLSLWLGERGDDVCVVCGHPRKHHRGAGSSGQCSDCGRLPYHNFHPNLQRTSEVEWAEDDSRSLPTDFLQALEVNTGELARYCDTNFVKQSPCEVKEEGCESNCRNHVRYQSVVLTPTALAQFQFCPRKWAMERKPK